MPLFHSSSGGVRAYGVQGSGQKPAFPSSGTHEGTETYYAVQGSGQKLVFPGSGTPRKRMNALG